MFLDFFLLLRQHALPVTLPEYLTLLSALRSDAGGTRVEDFYSLSKTILIKHEQHLDLFDRLFGQYVAGKQVASTSLMTDLAWPELPPNWLRDALENNLSEPEKAEIDATGGLVARWQQLGQLLARPKEQPTGQPGDWANTRTGPNQTVYPVGKDTVPDGFILKPGDQGDMGGKESGQSHKATKLWEQRAYKNLDDSLELDTRNLKMALRRLRILTREGVENELDISGTIDETGRNAGYLSIKMQAARRNRVKVLILFDVGGSMDEHVELCSHLFSAARYQFAHLEFMYFHNCVYETLWRDNGRRQERVPTWQVLHKYNKDYKVIFVGDAAMATHEITAPKGSVEHYNEEAGQVWLDRFRAQYPHLVWLNPNIAAYWPYTPSTKIIRDWSGNRMFPLTLNGLEQAMKSLKNPKITFTT